MVLTLRFIAGALILGISMPILVAAATPDSPVAREDYFGLDLTLSAQTFESPAAKTVLFGPSIDFIYRHKFNPYFDSSIDVAGEALTGSATGIMPTDLLGSVAPRTIFRLRDATVDLHTEEKSVNLKVGAINQRLWANPLLGGDIVFMGAVGEVKGETDLGTLSFKVEGAVPPTSFSLLETASQGKTPTFTEAQVSDRLGDREANFFGVSAGYFEFANLTTAQARQSLFWGNTVTGNTRSASYYLPFRGLEGGLNGGLKVTDKWQATLGVNAVRNLAAPAGANQGYLVRLGANYQMTDAKLSTSVAYFNDQSDSSPSVFSDGFLASKNHQGVTLSVDYDAKSYVVFASAMRSEALVQQLYAGRDTAGLVGVRVRYDIFK